MNVRQTLVIAVFSLAITDWSARPAQASIVGTTPPQIPAPVSGLLVGSPPASVVLNAFQANSFIRVFDERRNETLAVSLSVNAAAPGTYNQSNQPGAPFPTIPAGTAVDSYFIHFDPVSGTQTRTGSVTFDRDILGVIFYDQELDASDPVLGRIGTTYPGGQASRGLDFPTDTDEVRILATRRTIWVRTSASTALDQIRVITAAKLPKQGVTITLFGDHNAPTITVSNDTGLAMTDFTMTIGDTSRNFDCVAAEVFLVGSGSFALVRPDRNCSGASRSNDVDYDFTGFDADEVFHFTADVDIDSSNSLEDYRRRLFDLGGTNPSDNSLVTVKLSDATTVSALMPDFAADPVADTYQMFICTNQPPEARCQDPTVAADGQCRADANVDAGSSDPDGDPLTLTQDPPGPYALGPTGVTLTADDGLATDTCPATVTVRDETPPVVTWPGDLEAECSSASGANVPFDVTAEDNCSGAFAVPCTPASGSLFGITTTPVNCTATDASGNASPVAFNVTVRDTVRPTVTVPGPITAECTGPTGASVSFAASASDRCSSPTPTCAPASGSSFATGSTTSVSCTASDLAGNTGSAAFPVTVRDTRPPTLTLPADITTECTSPQGAQVTFAATANDLCSAAGVVCGPASGSTFLIGGPTLVNCTAADAFNNQSTGAFNVTVTSTAPTQTVDLAANPMHAQVNTSVAFSMEFTDNRLDSHTATWDFGDGSNESGTAAPRLLGTSHVYTTPNVYRVIVTITDRCGNTVSDDIVVVVFDPADGFTTGGGWFVPEQGSHTDGVPTDGTSKANFGFIVKYKKGQSTPDGNLEFQYKAGSINLKSTSMEWMVISATKVRFKGMATINGGGNYTFKVTAQDEGEPGTDDTFKIEIWNGPVDTENGPPDPKHMTHGRLGGGNIQIHQ